VKAGFHWICEIARCCGKKYVRKRLPGRPFSIINQGCFVCGQALAFFAPPKDPRKAKCAERERYQSRRQQHLAAGLTAHGSPRIRFSLTPTEKAWRELRSSMGEIKTGDYLSPLERAA